MVPKGDKAPASKPEPGVQILGSTEREPERKGPITDSLRAFAEADDVEKPPAEAVQAPPAVVATEEEVDELDRYDKPFEVEEEEEVQPELEAAAAEEEEEPAAELETTEEEEHAVEYPPDVSNRLRP